MFALVARRQKVQRARRGSLSSQLRDTMRYTSFLGAFAGIYVSVDEGIAALFGNRRLCTPRKSPVILHLQFVVITHCRRDTMSTNVVSITYHRSRSCTLWSLLGIDAHPPVYGLLRAWRTEGNRQDTGPRLLPG